MLRFLTAEELGHYPLLRDTMFADRATQFRERLGWAVSVDRNGWERDEYDALNPTYVIPGHGHPTNLAQVRRYTRDYLVDLREKIGAHIEEGGDLASAFYVDQEKWRNLDTFEELATRNAGRVFEEMEFE